MPKRYVMDLIAGTPPRLAEQFLVAEHPWPEGVRETDSPCVCPACVHRANNRGGEAFIRACKHEVILYPGQDHAGAIADGDWIVRAPYYALVRTAAELGKREHYRDCAEAP